MKQKHAKPVVWRAWSLAALALLANTVLTSAILTSTAWAQTQVEEEPPVSYADTVAVIIANSEYSQTDDVPYAVHDANAFASFAAEVLGARVLRFDNLGTNQMGELLGLDGRPGSLSGSVFSPSTDLYVYYAGHGTHDAPQDGAATRNYLLPVDANPDQAFLARQAYAIDDLKTNLRALKRDQLPRGRVTLVLESCFSGLSPSADGAKTSGLVRGVSAPPIGKAAELNSDDIRLWAATSPDTDFAVWDTEFERGVFTDALLSALHGGKADRNGDFKVTAGEMEAYVTRQVGNRLAALSGQSLGFRQRPLFLGMDPNEVVLRYPADIYPSYQVDLLRAIQEDFEADELLDVSTPLLASADPDALAKAVGDLRRFTAKCQFCSREERMRERIADLTTRLASCKAEQSLMQNLASRGRLSSLERLADGLECGYGQAALQACLATANLESEACQCLQDETCVRQASDVVPVCQADLAALESDPDAIADFLTSHPSCQPISQAVQAALDASCEDLALQAGVGQADARLSDINAFLAQAQACPQQSATARQQVAALERDFANETCAQNYAPFANTQDASALNDYIANNLDCPTQVAAAQQRLSGLLQLDASCQSAFALVENSTDARTLRQFVADFAACEVQISDALQRIAALERGAEATACLDSAEALLRRDRPAGHQALANCEARYPDQPQLARKIEFLRFDYPLCGGIQAGNTCLTRPEALKAMQTELRRLGCYKGGIDGDWGSGSRKALYDYNAASRAALSISSDARLGQAVTALQQDPRRAVCYQAPPAPPSQNYTRKAGVDLAYAGQDYYPEGLNLSRSGCQSKCDSLSGCVGFAYINRSSHNGPRCFPKRGFGTRRSVNIVDFYIKPGHRDTSRPGSGSSAGGGSSGGGTSSGTSYKRQRGVDLASTGQNIYADGVKTNLSGCKSRCTNSSRCIGFAYVTKSSFDGARCWLKWGYGTRKSISIVDFYIKQ